jgi:phosphoglycerate dehydrogenase-like enzyme
VYAADQLMKVLMASGYVVLCVPYTSETAALVGARELAALKPSAVLINIARGAIVDESALIEAYAPAGWSAPHRTLSSTSHWQRIVRSGTCQTCW